MKKELRPSVRYVLVVQCAKSRLRCSGFACENSFHERLSSFAGYPEATRLLSITCGGCGSETLRVQLEHFKRKLLKKTDISLDQVSVHLSSCMVTDNSHHGRCSNVAAIRETIESVGFTNITEGTYVSARAQSRRETGEYRTCPDLEID